MLFHLISLVVVLVVVFVSELLVVVYTILNTKFWGWYFLFIYLKYRIFCTFKK